MSLARILAVSAAAMLALAPAIGFSQSSAPNRAASGAYADGWDVTKGLQSDAACGAGDGTCSEIALIKYLNLDIDLLTAAIGSPIPSYKHCQTTALTTSLTCGTPAVAITDFSMSVDTTISASAWFLVGFDATSLPANGVVSPTWCFPEQAGTIRDGVSGPAGGWTMSLGAVFAPSVGADCFHFVSSAHATFIRAGFQ